MRKSVIGARDGSPAFFDMACRCCPPGAGWYGTAFRIGDRAAAYVWLADWRLRHPKHRITVLIDDVMPGTEYSRHLPGEWLFSGIADELWLADSAQEKFPTPSGHVLYHTTMWKIWRWLMHNRILQEPQIRPPKWAFEKAADIRKKLSIPDCYATIQPLFDAAYDVYRNADPAWWGGVAQQLARTIPVMVLGTRANAERMYCAPGTYPAWNLGPDPMVSLALICEARMHVGGATGTTLWAPIFNVPTLACYRVWAPHPGKQTDTRPMAFKQPVVFAPLGSDPRETAFRGLHLFNGVLTQSTPLG